MIFNWTGFIIFGLLSFFFLVTFLVTLYFYFSDTNTGDYRHAYMTATILTALIAAKFADKIF